MEGEIGCDSKVIASVWIQFKPKDGFSGEATKDFGYKVMVRTDQGYGSVLGFLNLALAVTIF